jgi:hypothetical protein
MRSTHGALLLRCLIAWWCAHLPGGVFALDWDEENAFCYMSHQGMVELMDHRWAGLAQWLHVLCSTLLVHVLTPYGLTKHYIIANGGPQGSTATVGTYTGEGIIRTAFHRAIMLAEVDPQTLDPHRSRVATSLLPLPHDPCEKYIELGSSDDRRPMAGNAATLAHLVKTMCVACWAVGGAVNASKLQAFHVSSRAGRLVYQSGTVDTELGPISFGTSELCFVKIPLLMGELPGSKLEAVRERLLRILAVVLRLQPSYSLVRRILLAFGISQLDYVAEAMPLPAGALQKCQAAIDRVATAALALPRSALKVALYCPISAGGFGVPCLRTRCQLRYVDSMHWALNSRNHLISHAMRWFVKNYAVLQLAHNDLVHLHDILGAHGLEFRLVADKGHQEATVHRTVLSAYAGGPIILVSDGSATRDVLSWGAAVVSPTTGVIATASCGVRVLAGYSWAAEWCGKLEALRLAHAIGISSADCRWAVADNISAILGPDGGSPSRSHWLDLVRLEYARLTAGTAIEELFTPAAHNTGLRDCMALWQEMCDRLAAAGALQATTHTYPFADVLHDSAVLYWKDHLVVNVRHAMDHVYRQAHPGPYKATVLPESDSGALSAWGALLHQARVPRAALRWVYWLRFTIGHHHHDHAAVLCPYCLVPCAHWGLHLQRACPVVAGAVLYAFRTLVRGLGTVEWQSVTECVVDGISWSLRPDTEPWTATLPSRRVVTWSGLLWASGKPPLSGDRRQSYMVHKLRWTFLVPLPGKVTQTTSLRR